MSIAIHGSTLPVQLFVLVFEDNQLELVDAGTIFVDEVVAGRVAANYQKEFYPPKGKNGYREIIVRPMAYNRRQQMSIVTSLGAITSAVADGRSAQDFGPERRTFFSIKNLPICPWRDRMRTHRDFRPELEDKIVEIVEMGLKGGWGYLEERRRGVGLCDHRTVGFGVESMCKLLYL
jgi:hypothetical protein